MLVCRIEEFEGCHHGDSFFVSHTVVDLVIHLLEKSGLKARRCGRFVPL